MSSTPSEFIVLALNSGSSSLKFGLYRVSASRTDTLFTGVAESIGEPSSQVSGAGLRKEMRWCTTEQPSSANGMR